MSKSQQKKVSIDFNIRTAYLPVQEPVEVVVIWKRGN